MHPLRKQRLQIVVMIVAASAIASGLIIYMPVSYTHLTLPTTPYV